MITLSEVLTHPLKNNRQDIADTYRELLLNVDDFTVYSIDAVIAEKSAELRAKYNIRTPDALQIAVAIENNVSLFITNDKELKSVKDIEILVLDDFK